MPAAGQVVTWLRSFWRSWELLKPYDWLCEIQFEDTELELPFAFLVPVVSE
jgi:hypothetical protein